jgi:hypothetical protein
MKTGLLMVVTVIIALSIFTVIAVDSVNLDKICQDSGGKRTGDTCLAPIIINSTKK